MGMEICEIPLDSVLLLLKKLALMARSGSCSADSVPGDVRERYLLFFGFTDPVTLCRLLREAHLPTIIDKSLRENAKPDFSILQELEPWLIDGDCDRVASEWVDARHVVLCKLAELR